MVFRRVRRRRRLARALAGQPLRHRSDPRPDRHIPGAGDGPLRRLSRPHRAGAAARRRAAHTGGTVVKWLIIAGVLALVVVGFVFFRLPQPIIELRPERIFSIGPLEVTNTMFTSW